MRPCTSASCASLRRFERRETFMNLSSRTPPTSRRKRLAPCSPTGAPMAAAARPAMRRGQVNIFDESRPMWRLFLIFLIPLLLSNILQAASQTVASIYLGQLIGVHALAAVSGIFPIIFLLISFLIGLSSGSTVLIGQAFGSGNVPAMKRVAGTTLTISLVLGII